MASNFTLGFLTNILNFDLKIQIKENVDDSSIYNLWRTYGILQGFVPGREVSIWDIVANTSGVFIGFALIQLLETLNTKKV